MRTIFLSLLWGVVFAAGGGASGFLIFVLASSNRWVSDWMDREGVEGPAGGVAFVMLILLLAVVAGLYGFFPV